MQKARTLSPPPPSKVTLAQAPPPCELLCPSLCWSWPWCFLKAYDPYSRHLPVSFESWQKFVWTLFYDHEIPFSKFLGVLGSGSVVRCFPSPLPLSFCFWPLSCVPHSQLSANVAPSLSNPYLPASDHTQTPPTGREASNTPEADEGNPKMWY